MIDNETKLRFGCGSLQFDPERHVAAYGARLIFSEVRDGGRGVVWDRQDARGPRESVEQEIFPVLDEWYQKVWAEMRAWRLESDSDRLVTLDKGKVHIGGSPQSSYGYLYVTAVLDK